jgi:hypothetical protein
LSPTLRFCIVFALFAVGCDSTGGSAPLPDGGADAGPSCVVGDPSRPIEFEVVFRNAQGEMVPLADGGEVPLLLAPQGGRVMFVGVRARNLDGCPVEITTSLRDVCNDEVVSLEQRPVRLAPTGDGWLAPFQPAELDNYSNLPACPAAALVRDIADQPYQLSIRLFDKLGREVRKTLRVVPTCGEPDQLQQCRCECSADYRLGEACRLDGGTSHADCPADAGTGP